MSAQAGLDAAKRGLSGARRGGRAGRPRHGEARRHETAGRRAHDDRTGARLRGAHHPFPEHEGR